MKKTMLVLMTIVCLAGGSAAAADVKEITCLDVAEMCNGANVHVTCPPGERLAEPRHAPHSGYRR